MTGSLLLDEVKEAYLYASQEYVMLDDLQDKVGDRIASLLGCEGATITSGAFSAMTLGTAGVLTGQDETRVAQLPDLEGTGMKTEVIIQKAHNIGYAHAVRNCGGESHRSGNEAGPGERHQRTDGHDALHQRFRA